MLDQLTHETLAPYIGQSFQLWLDPATVIPIELVEVTPHPPRTRRWDSPAAPLLRTPFAILFRGPPEPILAQKMYNLTHSQLGSIEDLFLVPVGRDQQGRYYEAIFS